MTKISCLIIDDEPPAVDLLKQYAGMVDQLEVVDTCKSAIKAFDLLKNKGIDLIFLDIRMPILNGIEFLKTLQNPPAVILTTAYREYALDGYDLDIIDYLLKPITFERFLKAVDRFRNRMDSSKETFKVDPTHVFFNINKTRHKILLREILYVESLKDYVKIHLNETSLVVKGNIGSILKNLPTKRFIRIHRSFAIGLSHVESFNQSEVVIREVSIPIGVSYRKQIMKNLSGI